MIKKIFYILFYVSSSSYFQNERKKFEIFMSTTWNEIDSMKEFPILKNASN